MNFELTEEQKLLRNTVQSFVKREISKELVREHDELEKYPHDLYQKMADLGWLGIPFPEEYGGTGGNVLDVVILMEELARGMTALAGTYIQTVGFGGMNILESGNKEQKAAFLPPIINGEKKYCLAYTEPNAGSDLASLVTAASPDGFDYLITGSKIFITGAHVSDYMIVATRTDQSAPKNKGITAFIVDSRSRGVTVNPLKKLGMRSLGTNEVVFDSVRVPTSNILGELNEGWQVMLKSLNNERCMMSAAAVGAAQAVVNDAIQYMKERTQFGQPISKFQVNQHKVVDMQMEVSTARILTLWAAWLSAQNLPCTKETSMAKIYSSEVFQRVSTQGVQILGGYGYMMEYDMQRHYRDSKFFEIAGGTNEIQRNIIARELGL